MEEKKGNSLFKAIDKILLVALLFAGIGRLDNAMIYSPRLQSQHEMQNIERAISYEVKEGKKPRNYAVLVGGQGIINSKWSHMDYNVQKAYDNLKKRGYADEDIMVLSSTIPKGRGPSSGINARPTPENLKNVLDFVAENSTDKDSLVFFYGGHGRFDKKRDESEISLGLKKFGQEELYEHAKNIKGDKLFIITACEAGGFVEKLQNLPGKNVSIVSLTEKEKGGAVYAPILFEKFWDGINRGEDIEEAYKHAVKGMNKKLSIRALKGISFGEIQNEPVIYERGNFQIPAPKSAGLKPEKTKEAYSEIEEKMSEHSKENAKGLEKMFDTLEYALLFFFFASFVFLAASTITGNVTSNNSLLKSSLSISAFLQIFLMVALAILITIKNRHGGIESVVMEKDKKETIFHGVPEEKILDVIKSGAVLSPARINKSPKSEFFEDVIADMGPDALKKYDNKEFIDIDGYLEEHHSSVYKHGSETTKKILDNWNDETKWFPELKRMKKEKFFRNYALWAGADEEFISNAYGGKGRAYFEFKLPEGSISYGSAGSLGIAAGGIPLKYATKIKVNDASKKEQYENALRKKGLSHVKVEVVE